MTRLEATALRAGYEDREVLAGVDLALAAGQMTALIGPNGAGKSTLLRCLAGLLVPSAGSVRLDGADLGRLGRRAIARRIAVVPQLFETLFPFTVEEVVRLGRVGRLGALGRAHPDDRRAVADAMEELELLPLAGRRIDTLSGGERQRAVIAMALAQEGDVLLLDEPTVHLDPAHQRATLAHIAGLAARRGLVVLAVLHDLNLAGALCDRVVLLDGGRVVADGPPADVLTDRLMGSVFGEGLRVGTTEGRPYVVPASLARFSH
ncbi:MAG: ABC transporter ATP-binding protein [Chloroflexota bacterium]|nr:ABC transporter ATP-binding protein [Chloroflexota bacterium]